MPSFPSPRASGKLVVSVRFTSGVGLTAFDHGEVAIRQPVPDAAEAAAKPAPELPGTIKGVVTENDIKQPSLEVFLLNPKPKDKENPILAQKTTDADGSYLLPRPEAGNLSRFLHEVSQHRQPQRYQRRDRRVGEDGHSEPGLALALKDRCLLEVDGGDASTTVGTFFSESNCTHNSIAPQPSVGPIFWWLHLVSGRGASTMSDQTQGEEGDDRSAREVSHVIQTACDRFEAAWQTGEAPRRGLPR